MAKDQGIISWKDLPLGCAILEPGNAEQLRTGDWRSKRPIIDYDKCIKCGMCYIYCPDICYSPRDDGFFEWNENYCKGCGICAHECPKDAISMVEEEK